MKKIIFLLFSFIFVLSNTCFAEWIYSKKADGWLYRDESKNELITNNWHLIDVGDNKQRAYYFNEYGFLITNGTTPDGKRTNERGEYIENGIVFETKKEIENSNTQIINTTNKELKTDTENKGIINTKNVDTKAISSNIGTGKLLKNYIVASQDVEILNEKNINGSKKTNVIAFKNNGAFISLNTKKHNKINLKCERDKTNKEAFFRLVLFVNGEEEDSIEFDEDEYEIEQEFEFKLNDDVDLVMYTNSTSSSWSKKYLYITNGRMSKYKEDDD